MNELRLIIITDMAPETGIGTFAYSLFKSLTKISDGIAFLYTGYQRLNYEKGFINYKRVESNGGYISKGMAKFLNQNRCKSLMVLRESNIHLCGSSYSMSQVNENTVATVHDIYFTKPTRSDFTNKDRMSSYLAYNFNVVKAMSDLKRIQNLTSISEVSRKQLLSKINRDSQVIHHWVDKERFHPRDKVSSRKMLNLPLDRRLLLNVSGGGTNKNLEFLTSFANQLSENWALIKVGYPINSHKVININKLDKDIYPILFNAADAYIHTSTFEGFGIPLIESLGSGLPVIALNTPSSQEILEKSCTYFTPSDSPKDILEKIDNVFFKENYNELVMSSLERSKFYSEEKIISKYFDFYRKSFKIF